MDSQNTVKLPAEYHKKNVTTDVISNQPIACPSDQGAGLVTCRTTIVSKNSLQGFSHQLSNLQIKRAFLKEIL